MLCNGSKCGTPLCWAQAVQAWERVNPLLPQLDSFAVHLVRQPPLAWGAVALICESAPHIAWSSPQRTWGA
jgi:hypothetical protein